MNLPFGKKSLCTVTHGVCFCIVLNEIVFKRCYLEFLFVSFQGAASEVLFGPMKVTQPTMQVSLRFEYHLQNMFLKTNSLYSIVRIFILLSLHEKFDSLYFVCRMTG